MKKLFIVSCESPQLFSKFTWNVNTFLRGSHSINYFTIIDKLFYTCFNNVMGWHIPSKLRGAWFKFEELLDNNNANYNLIINEITFKDYADSVVFLYVNNTRIINKLKRHYKRSKYYTLKITIEKSVTEFGHDARFAISTDYKYDNILSYVNDENFKHQCTRYIRQNAPRFQPFKIK